MNRELKFKIWVPYRNIMMVPKSIQHIHEAILGGITIGQLKQWVYLQFTGLKDCKDNEIYEGDIVTGNTLRFVKNYLGTNPQGKDFIGTVEYSGAGFRIKFPDQSIINRFGGSTGIFLNTMDHMEVIGNIYENTDIFVSSEKSAG